MDARSDKRPLAIPGKLIVTTPSDREIAMTRTLDAPRELVFDAWTKPELLKRWLYGPDDWPFAVCEVDLRVGGALRFEWRHRGGGIMALSGVYREIVPFERLVFTEVFDEDWTGGETLVTMTFIEHDGKTTVTQSILYSSRAARDGALKTAMEEGMAMSYNRLAEQLPSLGVRGMEKGASPS
ncbi:MAG: SRPBCC family protein [Candidatus Acidiferrales bacterium]